MVVYMAKASKKVNPPAFTEAFRESVRVALITGGLNLEEAGEKFNVSPNTIRQWCFRYKWELPPECRHRRPRISEAKRNADLITKAVTETWAERGEAHRSKVFGLAKRLLDEAEADASIRPTDVADLERLDKMARRAAGLDDGDGNKVQVAVNLALLDRD